MTLQQLKYAVGVARYGSFNEAATHLFISQPSLSNAIRELESEMGILIFTRSNRGVQVTVEGTAFLSYARQVLEQAELLECRYQGGKPPRPLFSVSTQHYAFAVNAFVDTIRQLGVDEYECTLRETKTHEILEDVKNLRSELGILYINEFNQRVLNRLFKDAGCTFTPLFTAKPHVFVSARHPLAKNASVTLKDLEDYPCLSFEQGEYNSFHFSEEIQSTVYHRKSVTVSDRATLFNLLIGLDGYTISTGILTQDLNGNKITAVPLDLDETITIGYIAPETAVHSQAGIIFLENLHRICTS
ncbi:MAG TPA: LysR family transcriptional regulator [Treponema sp.]|nr:LysR family transcriptional regulator [Treponema sp.]